MEEIPHLVVLDKSQPIQRLPIEHTSRYGNEPARIRYLIPKNETDLKILNSIADWEPAREQMVFPDTKKGRKEWLNEGNIMLKKKTYDERSFAVCDETGEMMAFINFYPLPQEMFDEFHDQLGIQPNQPGTLDLIFTCARRPDVHIPGLVASGHRQAFLALQEMVAALEDQNISENHINKVRIFAVTDPKNTAPQKLNEKIGLKKYPGTFIDSYDNDPPQELMLWELDDETFSSKLLPPKD
jgi:hypothetical protein